MPQNHKILKVKPPTIHRQVEQSYQRYLYHKNAQRLVLDASILPRNNEAHTCEAKDKILLRGFG